MNLIENRLAQETSPYLLQHSRNPVDWYAWNAEALEQAQRQDKPILLSIGYSACHWCHVMAHESFEDEQTAALMNEYFINIKVDREERPDLDKIYQLTHQLLTNRGGGWPLTLFLMPEDQTPFFAGTYFPPEDRYGMRSFRSILQAVHQAYHAKRSEIQQQNLSLLERLQQINRTERHQAELSDNIFSALSQQLLGEFDSEHGGFTPKPKFPHAYFIERCLRQFSLYGSTYRDLLEAGLFTARKMAQSGLFDQIAGGFCRYSTDEQWMIPHFEKMLYDNGQLMPLYVWAGQLRPDPLFERTVTLTADWLMREMQHKEGGYYSSQDADSEGEEGKYYVWQVDEVADILTEEDFSIFKKTYGLDRSANFEGNWYPHTCRDSKQLSEKISSSREQIEQSLERSRQQLLKVRSQRIKPATDDKILTSWNALMIRGMLIAGRILKRPEYSHSALRALDFVRAQLWKDQQLLATWKDGRSQLNAYLDDYAYLLLSTLEALQTKWDNDLFDWCQQLAEALINGFANQQSGGFYFTHQDHETLILRSQTFNDDAMPAGNAIAAQALYYLGYLSGQTRYLDYAESTIKAASLQMARQPMAYAAMFNAVDIHLHSATIIILRGEEPAMQAWQEVVNSFYLPDVLCFSIPNDQAEGDIFRDKIAPENQVYAYLCEGMSCRAPVSDIVEFKQIISGLRKNL
jgi:uncharacterized protein